MLLKAQQELKKNTDIQFEFDELTFDRKVEKILFLPISKLDLFQIIFGIEGIQTLSKIEPDHY